MDETRLFKILFSVKQNSFHFPFWNFFLFQRFSPFQNNQDDFAAILNAKNIARLVIKGNNAKNNMKQANEFISFFANGEQADHFLSCFPHRNEKGEKKDDESVDVVKAKRFLSEFKGNGKEAIDFLVCFENDGSKAFELLMKCGNAKKAKKLIRFFQRNLKR